MRLLYILGWGYVLVSGMLVYQTMQFGPSLPNEEVVPAQLHGAPAVPQSWFERVRPRCNPVEVEVTLKNDPPPPDWNSQSHAAACYALAGKIQKAAARIDALDQERWPHAAYIVFNAGHGVADAGDDESAGPIMELVLRYVPNHYMALYHAGMAEYRLGQHDLARRNLQAFMREYAQEDGWRSSARGTLRELGVKVP